MLPLSTRAVTLAPDRMRRVLELLAKNTRASRLRAAQILASAYELDEEERRASRHATPDDA